MAIFSCGTLTVELVGADCGVVTLDMCRPSLMICLPAGTNSRRGVIATHPADRRKPILRQMRRRRPGRPAKAKPTPDGKAVLFLRSQARVPQMALFEFDVASGESRELLTPELLLKGAEEKLTPEEKARRERMRVSVGGFTDFQISPDG